MGLADKAMLIFCKIMVGVYCLCIAATVLSILYAIGAAIVR